LGKFRVLGGGFTKFIPIYCSELGLSTFGAW